MTKYHKIQTVLKRNPENKFKTLLHGQFSLPCFEFLQNNKWVFTEKVDGTNIRVILNKKQLYFAGKTDAAQIPNRLKGRLFERFKVDQLNEQFPNGVCLYGEGYGDKIQNNGNKYRPDQDFVLFDVKIGNWWLISDMIQLCRDGIKSQWGMFNAEGIVARPAVELLTRGGERIITKLKTQDFKHE